MNGQNLLLKSGHFFDKESFRKIEEFVIYIRSARARNNAEVKAAMAGAAESISSIRGRKSSRSISLGL